MQLKMPIADIAAHVESAINHEIAIYNTIIG